uniref:BLTX525 n=1 Tax=Nephila pilipes TaxID=299642 RepID=A0A076KU54_NEPPI|nr:BLTX525 [Nephila pilipes]
MDTRFDFEFSPSGN